MFERTVAVVKPEWDVETVTPIPTPDQKLFFNALKLECDNVTFYICPNAIGQPIDRALIRRREYVPYISVMCM